MSANARGVIVCIRETSANRFESLPRGEPRQGLGPRRPDAVCAADWREWPRWRACRAAALPRPSPGHSALGAVGGERDAAAGGDDAVPGQFGQPSGHGPGGRQDRRAGHR